MIRKLAGALIILAGCTEPAAPAAPKPEPEVTPEPEPPADVALAPDVGAFALGLEGVGQPDPDRPTTIGLEPKREPETVVARELPGSDATEQERREAVLSILAGGEVVQQLPARATDEGKEFDRGLVSAMTPRGGRGGPVPRIRTPKKGFSVSGELPEDVVRRIVRSRTNEVRQCYSMSLRSSPKVKGVATFSWTIDADGTVTSAKAGSSSVRDKKLPLCIVKAIKRWKFPKPADGADVSVRFAFQFSPD